MDRRELPPKRDFKPGPPKWSSPLWFLPFMLLLLWFWQSTLAQFAFKTIAYSEFKDRLARGEVVECAVKESTIEGRIQGKGESSTPEASTNAPAGPKPVAGKKAFFFRTGRVAAP